MSSRSWGLYKRPSAQVGPCTGERAAADQSTCEQNAPPFALPSLNTANSDRCLFAASNAGLSEASPGARQIRLRDHLWPDAIRHLQRAHRYCEIVHGFANSKAYREVPGSTRRRRELPPGSVAYGQHWKVDALAGATSHITSREGSPPLAVTLGDGWVARYTAAWLFFGCSSAWRAVTGRRRPRESCPLPA